MNRDIRRKLIPILAIIALVLLFFYKLAFTNLILARGDTFLYFYPYWQTAAEALRHGRIPLWNPDLFMGAPFLANSQVGYFYPLNWLVWLFLPAPYAVSASILLHITIAAVGAYGAARRAVGLQWEGALITAVTFGLGGYLTAQVEHINQLQGLAWMPWFLVVLSPLLHLPNGRIWPHVRRAATWLALLFALQLTAGHTQSTFISGMAVALWALSQWLTAAQSRWLALKLPSAQVKMAASAGILALLLGGVLALLLTAVQLLPTIELIGLSSRQGGLLPTEVLSFSLHPLLITRTLLPVYGHSLFSEYTAVLPLTVYLLAFVGAWQWRTRRGAFPALLLVGAGLFLAIGYFNPFNWLLARVPGFDLFRVPARWLAMVSLGTALLVGLGWQTVWQQTRDGVAAQKRPLLAALITLVILAFWGLAAPRLAAIVPTGPEAPVEPIPWFTLLHWLGEAALAAGLFWFAPRLVGKKRVVGKWAAALLAVGVLFVATRTHPYNQPTTPEAFFDRRPSALRLLAENQGKLPGNRFLSISNTFFDPGDQAEIDTIYQNVLPEQARYDYTVAIKQKEIIAPNLPLVYGLPSVDGFDGGILPMAAYSEMARLVLPAGETTTDGRLREQLTAVPQSRWLDLFNVGYLITDKTGDQWHAITPDFAAFFDYQLPAAISAGEHVPLNGGEGFIATAVYVVTDAAGGVLRLPDGGERPLTSVADGLWRASLADNGLEAVGLALTAEEAWSVTAVTAVNETNQTFLPLSLGHYRLIHSGDVKIYENRDVLPRAFLVTGWQYVPDVAAAVAAMQAPTFSPAETAVVVGTGTEKPAGTAQAASGQATIQHYEPERITIVTESDVPALLILTDANYPGWQAVVDGQPAPVQTVDGFFRGVFVPAGRHEVHFAFVSASYQYGRLLTLLALAVLGLLVIGDWRLEIRDSVDSKSNDLATD
ncbi:MAG: hypothetical protein Kow0080_25340 [Candidatus Promineifilaceae bacterium]